MYALTLIQPMAWAMFHGKDVENRTWKLPVPLIGRETAIHAGQKYSHNYEQFVLERLQLSHLPPEAYQRGAVVGIVIWDRLINQSVNPCDPLCKSPWYTGLYGWVPRSVVELQSPVTCSGKLGLWKLPVDIESMVIGKINYSI